MKRRGFVTPDCTPAQLPAAVQAAVKTGSNLRGSASTHPPDRRAGPAYRPRWKIDLRYTMQISIYLKS